MVQLGSVCQRKYHKRFAVQLEGGEVEMGVRRIESREVVHNHACRKCKRGKHICEVSALLCKRFSLQDSGTV
jgi:hypothetical protein